MKKILPVLLLCFICGFTKAQKQTNQWRFGTFAALNFNSGVPVSVPNSACSTGEGCSSISDTAGNLLFYTDGITIWNKNNSVMANGTNLHGDFSSSQSGLIVPWPGSDSLYYVFTVDEQATIYGLQYSIVDISLQGGLGQVIQKNIPVITPTTEKLTAVFKPNGIDYWIISHGWLNNSFLAYELTGGGFNNTPVISNVGTVASGSDYNTIGYLKASPQGTKLAQAVWGGNYFELFDFNDTTGVVSHPLYLQSFNGASSGSYGVEFSPNGTKLYGTVITPGYVYQWDVSTTIDSLITDSKTLVGTSAVSFNGALQQATDGKIYMAEYGSSWLGVINDPDSSGIACNFVDNGFAMSNGTNGLGLPNNFPSYFAPPAPAPSTAFGVSNPKICEKFCVDYFDSTANNPTSWLWNFPGGTPSSSTDQNPINICYTVPGVYDVSLTTTNSAGTNTVTYPGYITVLSTPAFPTISQNGYVLTCSNSSSYQWQFNSVDIPGATNQSYTVLQTGFYSVVIADENGCNNSATIYVEITGVDEVGDANILISPNPSNGIITIDLSNASGEQEISVDVVNTLGQILYEAQINSHDSHIDLTHLERGIYLLEITTSQIQTIKKIILIN